MSQCTYASKKSSLSSDYGVNPTKIFLCENGHLFCVFLVSKQYHLTDISLFSNVTKWEQENQKTKQKKWILVEDGYNLFYIFFAWLLMALPFLDGYH